MKTRMSFPLRQFGTAMAISTALALGACSSDDDDGAGTTDDTSGEEVPGEGPSAGVASVTGTLDTDQEVPALATPAPDAAGQSTLEVDTATGAITGEVTVSGLTGQATMAHIHRGFAGVAGPVLIGLEGSADGTTWTVPNGSALDADGLEAFNRGELYFNVHTEANPAGEVRGQIVPEGTTAFTVRIANVSDETTLTIDDGVNAPTTGPVPLSPGAFIVHRAEADSPLLLPRDTANAGLESVAEDGDPAPYVAEGTAIAGATVFNTPVDADEPGPAVPGLAYEFTFNAVPGDKLGFVTMFVESNDWFYTPTDEDNSIALFNDDGTPVSGDVTDQTALWDAGSEADETPGAGPNQVLRQPAPNTGPDEPGVGVGSLESQGKSAPVNGPVIEVTITPAQ